MAKQNKAENKYSDHLEISEEEVVEVVQNEWKHFVFGAAVILLGVWFYSQYKETTFQRDAEASSQFTSITSELSGLISESLKSDTSKEFLEKEDRVIKNLDHLLGLKQATYSGFGSILKSAYLLFRDKSPSDEDISKLDENLKIYSSSSEALVVKELIALIKCRVLLQSGDKAGALLAIKEFLKESKILFPEASTLLLVSSSDNLLGENTLFIKEQLNTRPELEEATKKALSDLGYSL